MGLGQLSSIFIFTCGYGSCAVAGSRHARTMGSSLKKCDSAGDIIKSTVLYSDMKSFSFGFIASILGSFGQQFYIPFIF